MWNDHVRAEQLFSVSQLLDDVFPVMSAHLKIEHGHVLAGAARTGGVVLHLLQCFHEDDVEILQSFQKTLRLHKIGLRHVHENCIPSKARNQKWMFDSLQLCIE